MRRRTAALGTALFFALAPGVVAGVIPWLLTGWDGRPVRAAVRVAGVVLLAAGVPVLVHAFARFVSEGRGTPAPVAPTAELVVGGAYRWVRNPMYLAVGAVIAGQALVLGRWVLAAYLAAYAAAVVAFVRAYEEPTLLARYGGAYEAYRRDVPGWWPRRPSPVAHRRGEDLP